MKDLQGKVAFITGGGSGVGLGQAKVFSAAGMKVVIADLRGDHLDEAMAYFDEHGGDVHPVRLDITDREAYAAVAEEVESTIGHVQLLCNTAGVGYFGETEKATYGDWDWTLSVNLGGVVNGIQTFLPRMISYGQGGHIVNTASIAAFAASPASGLYTASKFAVRGLSEVLRLDLAPYDISVTVVCPAGVNTKIWDAVSTRPAKFGATGYYTPDDPLIPEIRKIIEVGMDPVKLAEKTLEGVVNDDLYVVPFAEFRSVVERVHEQMLAAVIDPAEDPDMEKRHAPMAEFRRQTGMTEKS